MSRLALAALFSLAACSKEPSFDERFQQQSADIQTRADAMQQGLNEALRASNAADGNAQAAALANE